MNIDNLKPLGAFIEYTIRPLMDEFKWFLEELEKRGIKVTETSIKAILNDLLGKYILYSILNFLQSMIVTVIVCLTALLILKK